MSDWRPENWDVDKIQNQALEECGWDKEGTGYEEHLVEAGADAMLEALRSKGIQKWVRDIDVGIDSPNAFIPTGVAVFIPEESK